MALIPVLIIIIIIINLHFPLTYSTSQQNKVSHRMAIETDHAVASGSGMHGHENSNHPVDNSSSNQRRNGTPSSGTHTDPNNAPNSELTLSEDRDEGNSNGDNNGNDYVPPPTPVLAAEDRDLHFNILVDLSAYNLRQDTHDQAMNVLELSHMEIVRRLRLRTFDDVIFNREGVAEQVIRFDGYIPVLVMTLVSEEDEGELLHRSLEQWLTTMMDLVGQGIDISVPWAAGAWEMRWYR